MKNKILLLQMELKYLLRQKFLWVLIILELAFIVYCIPEKMNDPSYDAIEQYNITQSFDDMSEWDKIIVEFCNNRKIEIENNRNLLSKNATEKIERLNDYERFEKEYLESIKKYYSKPVQLEAQHYLGWETFFLSNTSMSPYNVSSSIVVFIVAAAGILLLVKDRENNTLFWATQTGKGMRWTSYLLKVFSVFIYSIIVHIVFLGTEILGLVIKNYDMRHWFYSVINIPQYSMCDLNISILGIILIHVLLNSLLAISVSLLVFIFAMVLKKYIYLFVGVLIVQAGFFYSMLNMHKAKRFDIWWRLNPFSSFQLDRFITYDAINIANHAIDVRYVVGGIHIFVFAILIIISYKVWRKYTNGS